MDITVDASQLNSLIFDLGARAGAVGGQAATVVKKTAADIEADAKVLAPFDTGNLRNSISTTVTGDGRFSSITAEVGPTAEYGVHVEYGTSRMAPQPYLGPAFERRVGRFIAALEQIAGRDL